jgi:GNAT superfamily N-acetyltransferase
VLTRSQVREAFLGALAAENSCSTEDVAGAAVGIFERKPERLADPRRRRYERPDPDFGIVTTGVGAVVSATASCLPWVRQVFGSAARDGVLENARLREVTRRLEPFAQVLYGPFMRFSSSSEDLRPARAPARVTVRVEGSEAAGPLDPSAWPHALRRRADDVRPLRLVGIARRGGEVVGVATATEDATALWQIGIDVAEDVRGTGVGRSLTTAVGAAVLDSGAAPYYGTTAANIPSMRTALSAGFWPSWVEVFAVRSPVTHSTIGR